MAHTRLSLADNVAQSQSLSTAHLSTSHVILTAAAAGSWRRPVRHLHGAQFIALMWL